jgi:DNA replicative helicase MCM subunit Mcm2 (Cdc46/Mcm family)
LFDLDNVHPAILLTSLLLLLCHPCLSYYALQTRVFNLDNVRPIRDLDPVDIDTLVAVRGMVTRAGNIIPDLRCAALVLKCVYG